jgi:hypothetical protein
MATPTALAAAVAATSCFLLVALSLAKATTPLSADDIVADEAREAHEARERAAAPPADAGAGETAGVDMLALGGLLVCRGTVQGLYTLPRIHPYLVLAVFTAV